MSDPLYKRVLGEAVWSQLPSVTQALHSPDPVRVFTGWVNIEGGQSRGARWLAAIMGLPQPGRDVPARVTVIREGTRELLSRNYAGHVFETDQGSVETPNGVRLTEKVGSITTVLRLEGGPEGIRFHAERAFWLGLPLPSFLTPQVDATERAEGHWHCFDVSVSLRGLGQIMAYQGRLQEITDPV